MSMFSLDLPIQFQVMTYFSTCAAYVNIIQFMYYREFFGVPTLLLILTASYSVAMVVKVGWELAAVITAVFVGLLVGGYHLENCLFCIPPGSDGDSSVAEARGVGGGRRRARWTPRLHHAPLASKP